MHTGRLNHSGASFSQTEVRPWSQYLSQGLDPASRRNLWDVVKAGRAGRGIVLTTHSMEEAEVLCDRLGIFVDGRLVCVGAPKEIASRYGKYLVRPHLSQVPNKGGSKHAAPTVCSNVESCRYRPVGQGTRARHCCWECSESGRDVRVQVTFSSPWRFVWCRCSP